MISILFRRNLNFRSAFAVVSHSFAAAAEARVIERHALRPLVSLRTFASAPQSPDKNENPRSSPPPSEQQQEEEAKPEEDNNPIIDALRESIHQHVLQLKASSTMLEQTMADPLPSWQRYLLDTFGAWFSGYLADFIRTKIEKEFELNDFLEGAKDAFWMTHKLIGEEDYDALQPMVSAKLLKAVKTTGEEYKAGGLVWRTEIQEDVPLEAQLRRISFWTAQQIAEYDEGQAKWAPENASELPMPAGRWLVLWVQYKANQKTLITRDDGQIVAKLTDQRPSLWTFAAGPLPEKTPVGRMETPYWLLKFG